MKRLSLLGVIAVMHLSLNGCANPKDANKGNFKAAINDYLKNERACIKLTVGFGTNIAFPYETRINSYSYNQKKLTKFTAIGFLSSQILDSSTYKNRVIYNLTDKGLSHFDESRSGFCYGNLRVKEILNFTEPNSNSNSVLSQYLALSGYTASTVNYTTEIVDVDDWAKSKTTQQMFPTIKSKLRKDKPLRYTTILILTNDGWVDGNSFINNQLN